MTKSSSDFDRIIEQLMQTDLSKAERVRYLRELVRSGDDIAEEQMFDALRKLMDRDDD
ncbi:MAG: hypothetical protein VYA51_04005 [Planctomycetota bacterium]|nr:hypothetical protein [Planctomycetota bacterium]